MDTLFATFVLFAVVMAAMAIGVMVHGRRLKGSCGGVGGDCPCDDAAQQDCELKRRKTQAQDQAREAS